MNTTPTHVVVVMDVSNPLTSDHVFLGPACYILSVLCAVGMFQCFGVPESVRLLPGFEPRTFVTQNDFFRHFIAQFSCCTCQSPCRIYGNVVVDKNESERMREVRKVGRNNCSLPV